MIEAPDNRCELPSGTAAGERWQMLGTSTKLPTASPAVPTRLSQWVAGRQDLLSRMLSDYGGILLRGFEVDGPSGFSNVAPQLVGKVLEYNERAAARTSVCAGVYTSTDFPADHRIRLHHEMSYSRCWPARIAFYCKQPSRTGGCTPIADGRLVYRRIPESTRNTFRSRGVTYVRNFGVGVDMTWQDAFQARTRSDVDRYCEREGIRVEWLDHDRLRTRQSRQVVIDHPRTGDTLWFNHAHVFHWSSLAPEAREALLAIFDEADLPRNVCHDDGTSIDVSLIEDIDHAYNDCATRFEWEPGDILVLDNRLMAHGRDAFTGNRSILVSLGEGQ